MGLFMPSKSIAFEMSLTISLCSITHTKAFWAARGSKWHAHRNKHRALSVLVRSRQM